MKPDRAYVRRSRPQQVSGESRNKASELLHNPITKNRNRLITTSKLDAMASKRSGRRGIKLLSSSSDDSDSDDDWASPTRTRAAVAAAPDPEPEPEPEPERERETQTGPEQADDGSKKLGQDKDGHVWESVADPDSGDIYYRNVTLNESTWDEPAIVAPVASSTTPSRDSVVAAAKAAAAAEQSAAQVAWAKPRGAARLVGSLFDCIDDDRSGYLDKKEGRWFFEGKLEMIIRFSLSHSLCVASLPPSFVRWSPVPVRLARSPQSCGILLRSGWRRANEA